MKNTKNIAKKLMIIKTKDMAHIKNQQIKQERTGMKL